MAATVAVLGILQRQGVVRLASVAGCDARLFHSSSPHMYNYKNRESKEYKIVIVGGGTGGCSIASKFVSIHDHFDARGQVAVIEPTDIHYYQPMFTLVGAGLKAKYQTITGMAQALPVKVDWIRRSAVSFDPKNCTVKVDNGDEIKYQYLVVAMGMQMNYSHIKGLEEALDWDPMVCSNYSPRYVEKTYKALNMVEQGNVIFTFPNTPIKCAGAPQKIMYLADEILRKRKVRDNTNIMFNSSLGTIFAVEKYAKALMKVVEKKGLNLNFKHNLIEVDKENKKAVFEILGTGETKTIDYSFLHVTPPMSAPDVLKASPLANEAGYLDLNKHTLQHTHYENIFGLGDCTSLPTSKTAAAVSSQVGVLEKNLKAAMAGRPLKASYDGYTSCPLITSSKTCIMAEFDYDAKPLETFPVNQGKERMSMYFMKSYLMPLLYWHGLTRGYWNGPKMLRKLLHLGLSK